MGLFDRAQELTAQRLEDAERIAGIGDETQTVLEHTPTPFGPTLGEIALPGDQENTLVDKNQQLLVDITGETIGKGAEETVELTTDLGTRVAEEAAKGATEGATEGLTENPLGTVLLVGALVVAAIVALGPTAAAVLGGDS